MLKGVFFLQVEGLADLINAETEQQRLQAVRQMDGDLYQQYNNWSNKLTRLLAKIEGELRVN